MSTFKSVVWPCITAIAVSLAWVLINADKVIDNIDKFKSWYGSSAALEGVWNNSTEYDIDPPEWLKNQKDNVEIRLTIKDSVIDGTIGSGKLKELTHYFDYVLLTGKKRSFRDTLDAYAFDYVLGKKVYFGSFTIHRDGEKLIVKANKEAQSFFPEESILIKDSDVAFPNLNQETSPNEQSQDKK
ncbi:hypothetical protein ORL26_18075 [Raoultella ornithinolytica]|uniref:hypothetical protein n=1 Tax=Raoultella ornithinolytica TaxID=54291 RepID=UPI002245B9F7|nr:hypothetical protein [Raoultella ornithinolytica]MCW9581288.1 hypothetical protein [Raoultella ornithinolytica]